MSKNGEPLRVDFPRAFDPGETLFSPELEPGAKGLAIAFDQLHQEGSLLRFRLLVTACVPDAPAAPVAAILRDAQSGRTAALHLVNRKAKSGAAPASDPSAPPGTRWISAPLELRIEPGPKHPGVYVHVALQGFVSNLVCVPVTDEGPGRAA